MRAQLSRSRETLGAPLSANVLLVVVALMLSPWIFTFVFPEAFFWLTLLLKRLVLCSHVREGDVAPRIITCGTLERAQAVANKQRAPLVGYDRLVLEHHRQEKAVRVVLAHQVESARKRATHRRPDSLLRGEPHRRELGRSRQH